MGKKTFKPVTTKSKNNMHPGIAKVIGRGLLKMEVDFDGVKFSSFNTPTTMLLMVSRDGNPEHYDTFLAYHVALADKLFWYKLDDSEETLTRAAKVLYRTTTPLEAGLGSPSDFRDIVSELSNKVRKALYYNGIMSIHIESTMEDNQGDLEFLAKVMAGTPMAMDIAKMPKNLVGKELDKALINHYVGARTHRSEIN